jgi:hypothetical protein
MKLTSTLLKQLIKEEVEATTVKEAAPPPFDVAELDDLAAQLQQMDIRDAYKLIGELEDQAEDPALKKALHNISMNLGQSTRQRMKDAGKADLAYDLEEITRIVKEEMDDVGGGAYITHGEPGGSRAHAPRTGKTAMLADEILRLSAEEGAEPHEYLVSLGFNDQGADNLLGTVNLLDYVKGGITFKEGTKK